MDFFEIMPQAAGVHGEECVMVQNGPQRVTQELHYEFQFFPEDDAVYAAVGICMVTEPLAAALAEAALTGFTAQEPLKVSISDEHYEHLWTRKAEEVPRFLWLRCSGEAFADDFGTLRGCLVVSHRALLVFQRFKMRFLRVTPLPDKKLPPPRKLTLEDLEEMKEDLRRRMEGA